MITILLAGMGCDRIQHLTLVDYANVVTNVFPNQSFSLLNRDGEGNGCYYYAKVEDGSFWAITTSSHMGTCYVYNKRLLFPPDKAGWTYPCPKPTQILEKP